MRKMLTTAARFVPLALFVGSFGLVAVAQAATFTPGDLIKAPEVDTVYYYGQNGKRLVFPTANTYFSWYPDFSGVKAVTLDDLQNIPLGGNVTYRPGVKMVKITTDPKVYAVSANGVLRWIETEDVATALYGANWNTQIDDVPDAYFTNYTIGTPIASASDFNPASATALAASINVDKQLQQQGPPTVTLSASATTTTDGGTVTLTVAATFQGSGAFQGAVLKDNGSQFTTCSQLPCTVQSPALAVGSSNAFTAEVTDSNAQTGVSSPATVTVTNSMSGY
ncbi:MAG: hypothetical protein WA001_01380 [Patescibacteria group bacterium]